jgi:hypothetical protein
LFEHFTKSSKRRRRPSEALYVHTKTVGLLTFWPSMTQLQAFDCLALALERVLHAYRAFGLRQKPSMLENVFSTNHIMTVFHHQGEPLSMCTFWQRFRPCCLSTLGRIQKLCSARLQALRACLRAVEADKEFRVEILREAVAPAA